MYIYIYVYIYIERERKRERLQCNFEDLILFNVDLCLKTLNLIAVVSFTMLSIRFTVAATPCKAITCLYHFLSVGINYLKCNYYSYFASTL